MTKSVHFNFWGTCCEKKHDFLHFFWHCFHFPPHFTKQKCMTNSKKCVFWHFALHYPTKKNVFFKLFFAFFLTKQFSILHHIIKNSIFLFFMLILQQTSKKTSISPFLLTLWNNLPKKLFCPMMSIVDFFSIHFENKRKILIF